MFFSKEILTEILKKKKKKKIQQSALWTLTIKITFSLASAKKTTSLSLFIFTHKKYIYLKRRINFLSSHGTQKK